MEFYLLKFKTKNLKLYSEKAKAFFEKPKMMYFCDGGVETYGLEFTIFYKYFYFHSERFYKTFCDL